MSEQSVGNIVSSPENVQHKSEFKHFCSIFFSRKVVIFGLIIILAFFAVAIFAPVISPYNPDKSDVTNALAKPSIEHWLGTDILGRDILSRIIYGSRISLLVSLVSLASSVVLGMPLGLIAGYFGGWIFTIVMRAVDVLMSIPMILLALTIAAVLGGGLTSIIIALGIALVPIYARLMCGQALAIRQKDYIMAAISMGASNMRIMFHHVFLNCIPPLIVMMTVQLGATILAEAGLSFLGVGVKPPLATWGNMVSEGYNYLTVCPALAFAPGIAIMLVVFSFNMVGDGLRDALDPRLRGLL